MRMAAIVLAAALVLVAGGPVSAIEVYPGPPDGEVTWDRTDAGTTWQHWTFPDENLPAYPQEGNNPFGEPWFEPTLGTWDWGTWPCPPEVDPSGTCTGWHCSSPEGGTITITINNNDDPEEMKIIFMQVTSAGVPSNVGATGSGGASGGYTTGTWPPGTLPPHQQWPGPNPFGSTWYTYMYGFIIQPNPEKEVITIEVNYCTVIDQIVIDTICTTHFSPVEGVTWSVIKALFE